MTKSKVIGGNSKLVRNINRAAILNLVRERQPISRVDIARITRLNKSTVSSIVAELLADDYLVEKLVADTNVGRNPLLLSLNIDRYYVGAVNFDTELIRCAIVGVDGSVVCQAEQCMDDHSPQAYVASSMELLDGLRAKAGIGQLEGIGVTIAGLIDVNSGEVIYAPNLGWKDVSLNDLYRQHNIDGPGIRYQNDAGASALAELSFGNEEIARISDFVFLSIGAGVGTGIVIDHRVIEGASHAAGEFGHMTLFDGGEACVCGNSGCWEVYASDRATVRRYRKRIAGESSKIMMTDLVALARRGDADAVAELKQTGVYIGMGLSNIVHAIDPPAIVVGGHIIQAWDIIYDSIIKGLSQRSFFGREKKVRILTSSLKERPRLIGAATLVIENIFRDYKITR
jgi:predicted NBD/HSP70 family sugar kinase